MNYIRASKGGGWGGDSLGGKIFAEEKADPTNSSLRGKRKDEKGSGGSKDEQTGSQQNLWCTRTALMNGLETLRHRQGGCQDLFQIQAVNCQFERNEI